jgi:nicotinate-nucleotide adenylyltransferase
MPAGEAPHKRVERDPGKEVRHELCVLAAGRSDWLQVSRVEIDRPGPSYTVETIARLLEGSPGDELFFIAGADQAIGLPEWKEPSRLMALARLAVAERDELTRKDVRQAIAGIENSHRVTFFPMPYVAISSSEVRIRVATGRPYRYLLPEAVADRIEQAGLYRAAERA